jgi:hypothetical protein
MLRAASRAARQATQTGDAPAGADGQAARAARRLAQTRPTMVAGRRAASAATGGVSPIET